jgi:hypothetical protein
MSIALLRPSIAQGRIHYIPAAPQRAFLSSASSIQEIAVAFSPWLVGSNIIVAPSIMSGHWDVSLGPYTVRLEAPDNPHVKGIAFSQHRPKI